MGAGRLPMRKIREVLRLKYEGGLRHRAIARACGVGTGTVSEYVTRAAAAGLSWPLPPELDDTGLEVRLFGVREGSPDREMPDLSLLHQELKRPGVTLQLLWEEYREGLRLQSLLRHLPSLGAQAPPVDAAGASCGGEDLRRLLWQAPAHRGPEHRRRALGRAVRRVAGSQWLHIRRSDADAAAARVDCGACPARTDPSTASHEPLENRHTTAGFPQRPRASSSGPTRHPAGPLRRTLIPLPSGAIVASLRRRDHDRRNR